ncbi:hypothetical protein GGI03_007132 [Coemansia sp. RSA 2337]|nr:hypothetical protein H4S03_002744 [Coemansia sp. S3946]KAJ2049375.1 hypothetical protein H4S04_003263 [Coemansia sp. S16]KAJ2107460.1 hypothetical protein IW146_007303 [Coemansia sp. RSA 922]KAJ2449170.1 hypothetical protein GGI03_007132 [Coemansia sp. RSA 2337]
MDIDDDNSSAGTLHNEGQNIPLQNSTTRSRRRVTFNIEQDTTGPEETMPSNMSADDEASVPLFSPEQSAEETSRHMTLSYSPLGMVSTAWTATGHTALPYLPINVHSLLPDGQGICHYHRPSFTPQRGGDGMLALPRSLIARGIELRNRESMLASNLEFAQRESLVRLEASQRALEQVVRRLATTRRCLIPPAYGREQYSLGSSSAGLPPSWIGNAGHSPPPTDGEWVSDTEENEESGDPLTSDTYDLLIRMQVRSAARRANGGGIYKSAGPHRSRRGRYAMHSGSLGTAYSRFKNDDCKTRETVTSLGQGNSDEITAILGRGVSVNISDSAGRTPLHVACSGGNLEAVRLLIHLGANVNATDNIGNTPLTIAATGARTNVILPLLEGGADPRIGTGMISAMAMVRSRLRLLRMQIRQARTVEQIAADSCSDILPRVKERRKKSVEVAKECVEIIRLLREYTKRYTEAENSGDPLRDIYEPKSEASGSLTDAAVSELDSLSEQLLSMGIAGPRDDVKGKMPDLLSLADNDVQEQGSSSSEVADEDKQIEDLLEKFSLLLGDDGSTETRDNN